MTAGSVRRRRLVTFSSDFGAAYAAQVKAVLARSLDPARIVELTHDLPAHRVGEAAFLLRAMAVGFPPGTVHLAVVDPGVGGPRRPIAIDSASGSRLVGPDNGLLMPLAHALGRFTAYAIDAARWGTPARVGTTFDGRDLFAPVAARLAAGVPPARLGPRCTPVPYDIPTATPRAEGAVGAVLHVDRFGNLITNVPTNWVPGASTSLRARLGGARRALPWVESYSAIGRGRVGALGSSFGTVELSVAEGSASRRLRVRVGDRVVLDWGPRRRPGSQSVNSERRTRR